MRLGIAPIKTILALAVYLVALGTAGAEFIDFTNKNVKVVFTQESVGGVIVVTATATVSEQDPSTGVITVRRQIESNTPDGSGGFIKVVIQETTIATPDSGDPGVYSVETTTRKLTSLVNSGGNEIVIRDSEVVDLDPLVPFADLDLPPSTEFVPSDPELDDPILVSPL